MIPERLELRDAVAAFVVFAMTVTMVLTSDANPAVALALYAALFLPYAYFVARAARSTLNPVVIVALGLAVRGILIFAEPVLSDDIFRYVWEGRVSMAAHNPFYLAPSSEVLLELRDTEIWPQINHADVPTIYPPMAQFSFALNALWNGGTTSMRAIFVAVEFLTLAILWRWSRDEDTWQRILALTLYVLNPLVFVEVAWSGHLDVLAWCALVLGLVVWQRAQGPVQGAHAGFWLGMSIATKFLGLMALAALILSPRRGASWRAVVVRRSALVATAALIVAASYLPYIEAGPNLFSGFGTYAAKWRSNDGGFRLMTTIAQTGIERWAPDAWRENPSDPESKILVELSSLDALFVELGLTKTWEDEVLPDTTFAAEEIAQSAAKMLALLFMALALMWCVLVEHDPFRQFLVLMGVLLLVAPTVHPWYVAWLIPFAALRPHPAPLAFSALVLVSYGAWLSAARAGPWSIPDPIVAVEYLTVLALAIGFAAGPSPGLFGSRRNLPQSNPSDTH